MKGILLALAKVSRKRRPRQLFFLVSLIVLVAIGVLPYLPGLNGPYVFDDYSNLLKNIYVKVQTLDAASLYQAAFSLNAGPLQRPVAMLSFAINYYFAGGFESSFPFKAVNLVIHALNTLLVFWLVQLLLRRLLRVKRGSLISIRSTDKLSLLPAIAGLVALFWATHPIQITSVLYVVQRMAELSACFTLCALIFYLKSREALLHGRRSIALSYLFGATAVFWPLGLFSKENALLLPIYILAIETTLFASEWPWSGWRSLSLRTQRFLIFGVICIVLSGTGFAISLALPVYEIRSFTLIERLLTESRVLVFYLSLIFIPRINEFGLLHDDIPISTSLVSPWTTLPSLTILALLLVAAIVLRKRYPLGSLGIFWFFAAHALESTVFALEIAHEHRNYLALLGALLFLVQIVAYASRSTKRWHPWLALPVLVLLYSAVTWQRAHQWGSGAALFTWEAVHHPNSAGAQSGLANVLLSQGHYAESREAMRRASELAPDDPTYLIAVLTLASQRGEKLQTSDIDEVSSRLQRAPATALTQWALSGASDCLLDGCMALQQPMQQWIHIILDNRKALKVRAQDESQYLYFLGRSLRGQNKINEAIEAFRKSYELDPHYFHPLIDLTILYIEIGRVDLAGIILDEAKRMNTRNPFKRDEELKQLDQLLEKARSAKKISSV